MSSLLSAADIQTFRDVIDDVHDTFKQPMTVISHAEKAVTTTSSSYNPLYNRPTTNVTLTEQTSTVQIRAKWFANEGDDEYVTDIQNRFPNAVLRIKVAKADSSTVKNAESFILHGQRYEVAGEPIPLAPFGNNDYDAFYLKLVK